MSRVLTYKLAAIGLLLLLLLIPLLQIRGVIFERQTMRNGVLQEIARSSSYQQKITGPLLVIPYHKTIREWRVHPGKEQRYQETSEVAGQLYFLPESFRLKGDLRTEVRSRGIYQARLYHADSQISGAFAVPENFGVEGELADYRFEPAFITVGISDIRGIEKALKMRINNVEHDFKPGSRVEFVGNGAHVNLEALDPAQGNNLAFAFALQLQGTGQLDIAPIGRDSEVVLKSDWPHPSFIGEYLPVKRDVGDSGFSAQWQASFFSTNMEQALAQCGYKKDCSEWNRKYFGVSLVDPVDQYLKSERAIKYALLFLGLTFAGFFLFEVLKQLAVHPVQYALVGLALAFFYLLLLSLSEHIGFARAYLFSSLACLALIGFYVCHVLHSWWRGMGFTAALGMLYAMLYGVLSSEDYALLMGALLLFAVLGVFMVATRKLDWYGIGRNVANPA